MTTGNVNTLVATVAGYGLDVVELRPPAAPLDDATWSALAGRVTRERQWGPLAWAVTAGWWPATPGQTDLALERHRTAMATALRLERTLLSVTDLLASDDIESVVLKGPALARLDYPDPSLRSFGDVDLLVAARDIARTGEILASIGAKRRYGEPRPGFDRRFGKGMCMRLPTGVEIDLHRTLTLGPFGLRIDPDILLRSTEGFQVGDQLLRALDPPGRFVHACVHAALGSATPTLTSLRDVAQTSCSDTDVASALALVTDWQCGLVVAHAVRVTARTLRWRPSQFLRDWVDQFEPTRRERRWLAGYHGESRSSARHAIDSLAALDSWSDRAAYATAALLPRERNTVTRWKRGVRTLTRRPQA